MDSEINELVEDNRMMENELRNLGEKTNMKIGDMQKKMESNINDLESFKGRNEHEVRSLNETTREKLERMNEDFAKRMEILKDKLDETHREKQEINLECMKIKDFKRKNESDLEAELARRKERFYDESFAQFNTVMKVMKNNLRQATEDKNMKAKKLVELTEECDNIKKEFEGEVHERQDQDESLRDEVKKMKQEVTDRESIIEANRADIYSLESELQKESGELQKNRFELRQVSEKGDYDLKELKHRFQIEREQETDKNHLLAQKNDELLQELRIIQEKVRQQRVYHQKTVESMRNQLNRNIFQTINEHKESRVNVPVNKHVSKGGSFYLNNR